MSDIKKCLLMSAVLLTACTFVDEDFNESNTPVVKKTEKVENKEAVKREKVIIDEEKEFVAPQSSTSDHEYESNIAGRYASETGTFVGQKIADLRRELSEIAARTSGRDASLDAIRKKIAGDASKYHELVAIINSRLQVGTTPGNPILNDKWHQAGIQLDAISNDVGSLNGLVAELTADSGMVTYVLDSVKAAFNISGAVDEDHDQLKVLENQAIQTSIQIERLYNEINNYVNRQQQFLAIEKKNISALSMAIRDGQLYSQDPFQGDYGVVATSTLNNRDVIERLQGRTPLVSIRFDKHNVAYEQALYQAVKRAVARKNNVHFDVIGITPLTGTMSGVNAQHSADAVSRSIVSMGVPSSRVNTATVTLSDVKNVEVRVFVK